MLVWVAIWLFLNHNLELSDKKYAYLTRQIMSYSENGEMGRLVKVPGKGFHMSVGPRELLPQALLRDQFQSIQPGRYCAFSL